MKPSALRSSLAHLVRKQRPPFLWGAPGVGKSDLVAQVAKDLDMELRDVRMSLLDPTDLKGFPVPDIEKSVMRWLAADFLPPMAVKKGAKTLPNPSKGILFLDEMNSAAPAVQATGYQLILNRRVGEYTLPAGWSVIAAGNRTGDRSIVHTQPAALANRFVHLDFDVNVEDWMHWAMDHNIHTDLRAFIAFRPALLHVFDPKENPRAYPTPRSWAFVNDIYQSGLSQDQEYELIKGTVGEGVGIEFTAFVRLIKDLPTVDEVLLNPDTAPVPSSPGAKFAISAALDTKTTKTNIGRAMAYIGRMPIEYQVMYIRNASRRDRSLVETKTFMDWAVKNEAVMK